MKALNVLAAALLLAPVLALAQEMTPDQAAAATATIEPVVPAETPVVPAETPAPAARPETGAATVAGSEWEFYKASAESKDEDMLEAVLPLLGDWALTYPDSEFAPDALLLKAGLHQKLGDYKSAVIELGRLVQEYPSSKAFDAARQQLSILADKKFGKKDKPALMNAASAQGGLERPARLAWFLGEMTAKFGKDYYDQLVPAYAEFFVRFPGYAGRDAMQLALAALHVQKGEYVRARLEYERLIKVFPDSQLQAKAKRQLGDVLAENLKDYFAAIKVYRDIADKYPGTEEAWAAYLQLPRLTEKQKQYPLAVEIYENIIKLYPDKPEARDAFKAEARILREELSRPAEAIAVLNRLADKYKDESAVEELYLAAEISRKDLKDLEGELKAYDRIAADYTGRKEAPKALLAAGQACEKNKNPEKAKEYYQKIVSAYPDDSAASKAKKYITAIEEAAKKG